MILAVSTFTYVKHMYTLIFDDAGTLKQHHLIHAFGKPLNIVDVPSGRCKEFDFCPFTEVKRLNFLPLILNAFCFNDFL